MGSIILFLVTSFFVLGVSSSKNYTTGNFLECLTIFQNLDPNDIYTPNNASYTSILQSTEQNLRPASTASLKPLAILTPSLESEIQAAIYCSKKHGLQIRVRSGGHDYEGLSYVSEVPFVIVDMRNLQSMSIDTEEKTAWVQTGVTLGRFYYKIAQTSKTLAFPGGVYPTVGIGGHVAAGGFSMMSRKHGLAADNVIDATLINVDGQILDRKSMGEDLFWAIRGGGAMSFGIITAYKVKLVVVPETLTVANVPRTLEQNATQLVLKWQQIAHKIDEDLLIRIFLRPFPSSEDAGKMTVQASFTSLFLGRVDELLALMQENFPELGLVKKDCIEMSWIESVMYFAGFQNQSLDLLLSRSLGPKIYFKGKSDFVKQPIPERGLRGIWRFLVNEVVQNGSTELQLSPYGGFFSTFSESETPFPHRAGNMFMIHYAIFWTEGGNQDSKKNLNWIRRLYSFMTPYVSKSPREAYFGTRDLDLGMNNVVGSTSYGKARIWGFKYFKNNFDRLVHVKTEVDPSNFFRNEQSIPPLS